MRNHYFPLLSQYIPTEHNSELNKLCIHLITNIILQTLTKCLMESNQPCLNDRCRGIHNGMQTSILWQKLAKWRTSIHISSKMPRLLFLVYPTLSLLLLHFLVDSSGIDKSNWEVLKWLSSCSTCGVYSLADMVYIIIQSCWHWQARMSHTGIQAAACQFQEQRRHLLETHSELCCHWARASLLPCSHRAYILTVHAIPPHNSFTLCNLYELRFFACCAEMMRCMHFRKKRAC